MVNVTLTQEAKNTLRSFVEDDRLEVQHWLEELKGWKPDKFSSRMTGLVLGSPKEKLYMLKTDSEIRLLFRKDPKGIEVIEIIPLEAVKRRVFEEAKTTKRDRIAHAS